MSSTLGPDDPTPNPDAMTPAQVNTTLRRLLERVKALEDHRIVDTINEHEDRLDTHGERLDAHDARHAATEARHQKEYAATSLWREGHDKKLSAIGDGIGRLENALGTKP